MIVVLYLLILPAMQAQAKSDNNAAVNNKAGALTIAVTKLDISSKTLRLDYEIRNNSQHDVWICEDINISGEDFELRMAEDGQTLLIRRRHDVPLDVRRNQPRGRYVHLRTRESRTESLLLPVPVRPRRVFLGMRQIRPDQPPEHAKRLAIEIGFYSGDLFGMVLGLLYEAEKSPRKKPVVYPVFGTGVLGMLGGSLYFTRVNEGVRDRDEQVLISYTCQTLSGEQILRTTVDGLNIPYENEEVWPGPPPPDLSLCTRLEIWYQPSMLEYFFPYAGQQSLLSRAERQYLQSQKTVVVDDQERVKTFADEIGKGLDGGGIVTEHNTAHVVCYHDDESLTSFTVYDEAIETEGKQRFRYGRGLPDIMKKLTPQIQPFELRVQCTINLKNLWNRLRLYHKANKGWPAGAAAIREMAYPAPTEWCDAIVRVYESIGTSEKNIMRPHVCPSGGEGKSHYAMNPNCRPNSPPDTVLLFETKAGWNQHGGPELFTFNNHDPHGGCVLLNDGTVKFIRAKTELQELRWK